METQATFRCYSPGQLLLLLTDTATWLPEGHLAYFIRDVVGQLDLSAIYTSYDGSNGGYPPLPPRDDGGTSDLRLLRWDAEFASDRERNPRIDSVSFEAARTRAGRESQ